MLTPRRSAQYSGEAGQMSWFSLEWEHETLELGLEECKEGAFQGEGTACAKVGSH